ncbi:glycosyltransferase [Pseudomonas sp. JDS28PS106]|uniref:glycosyltransferase n=1 Tax=Pseudomonas sp. JDS28PS106 TaxID=2497235 RepID=UPI002FD6F109
MPSGCQPCGLPRVAVLLAAFNGVLWIEEQLDSILTQTNVDVSVFISVDTSSDWTEAFCESYAERHANVTLLPPSGRFGGAARNFFRLVRDVDYSVFDYVAFSDQDDVWHRDKLELAVARLKTDDFDAYSSNVTAFWPNGKRLELDKAQPQVRCDHLFEAAGPGCTYVLNRRLADAFKASLLNHWDHAQQVTLHDWYCYAFARNHGFRWFIDPTATMEYRQHADNQVGANTGIASFTARLRTITNGWWPAQVLLISQLTDGNHLLPRKPGQSTRLLFLKLIFKAKACRRRRRDKVLFVMACLLASISRPK